MITFFHTADSHFGVENYGKINQETGIHSRLLDFKRSFEQCVDQAIADNIDLFLFCGDAYKTAYPTPTQQKLFIQLLFKLYRANIPVVIIVGNHDHPLSFGKAHALDVFVDLPLDGIYVFSRPELKTIQTKNGPIQVVGVPWPMRHNVVTKKEHRYKHACEITQYLSEQVGKIITHLASECDPNIPAILAGHLTVSTGVFSGSEKCAVFGNDPIFLPSQLAIRPFDYVALGHLHRHQNLNPNGYPAVVYSGSPERIDFGERKETKGYCLGVIDTAKDERCSHVFVELETRPMVQIEIKLKQEKDQTEQLLDAIGQHDIIDAIVKIVYHVSAGTADTVDLLAVQRACSTAHCIASINPIRVTAKRERRVAVDVGMDFETILNTYLESKDALRINKENVRAKARELYAQLEADDVGVGEKERKIVRKTVTVKQVHAS